MRKERTLLQTFRHNKCRLVAKNGPRKPTDYSAATNAR